LNRLKKELWLLSVFDYTEFKINLNMIDLFKNEGKKFFING